MKNTISPKQLMNRLYNNAWETKNWQLTKPTKRTLLTGVLIIAAAAVAANQMEK